MRQFFRIIAFSLLAATTPVNGQMRTYAAIEAGPNWDINRVIDGGNYFEHANTFSSVAGISLHQEVLNNLFIGTGAYYHTYYNGINLEDDRPVRPAWKGFGSLLIPASLSYRIQTSDFPAGLTVKAGYQFGLILDETDPYSLRSSIADPAGVVLDYTYTENSRLNNTLHLLEFGAAFDYLFRKNWKVAFEVSHFTGLTDNFSADLDYVSTAGDSRTATYSMEGGRLQGTFKLYVPVSNIWTNRDLRIRTRIEHGSWRGDAVRKRRYIYFGGDIGALWRSFRSDNPAVGPRPPEGRGIFRYSNLHTGGYVGYMFNSTLGVDIGAWYQRSSVMFAMMFDHEPDYTQRQAAPFFLEIPLMFKYFYNVHKDRVHVVPALGVTVLTHFSGAGYASGTGSFDFNGNSTSLEYTASRTGRFGVGIRAGLGGEYRIPINFPLVATVYAHYSHGLTSLDRTDISTSLPEQPEISSVQYLGSGWKLSAGVRIPILLGKENRRCGAQMPGQ